MKVRKTLSKLSIGKLLLAALFIRLLLVPLSFHSDLTIFSIWGKYASEFGLRGFYDWLSFGNYARPDYPPLSMVLLLVVERVWQFLFAIAWKINISIPVFPSNFIPWFEKEGLLSLIKLPGVFADLGIGYLIYGFFAKKSVKKAKLASSFYLFNPGVIYLTASWGQFESVVGFFALFALLLLLKKKYIGSFTSFFVSIMLKATMIPSAIFLAMESIKQKVSYLKYLTITILGLFYFYILGVVFIDKNPISWGINLYLGKLIKGPVTLPYINLNAFNFWGLILGLERVMEETLFLAIPLNVWAWGLAALFALFAIWGYLKGRSIFFAIAMLFFLIFMFVSRVHERYLYPVFIFLPFVAVTSERIKKLFYILSITFLVNLYHWWWFPKVGFLITFFDLEVVERALSLLNLAVFGIMLKEYIGPYWRKG